MRYITTWHTLREYPSFQPLVTTARPHSENTSQIAICWITSLVQNVSSRFEDDAARRFASRNSSDLASAY